MTLHDNTRKSCESELRVPVALRTLKFVTIADMLHGAEVVPIVVIHVVCTVVFVVVPLVDPTVVLVVVPTADPTVVFVVVPSVDPSAVIVVAP